MKHVRIAAATVGIILIGAIGVLFATGLSVDFGPEDADLSAVVARAADYDVEIRRDGFGMPHIYGTRDADVAFGLGYAQAEDDFATVQEVAVATRGDLAAYKGPDAAVTDYLVRLLRIWPTVNDGYDTLTAHVRAVAEAYANGVTLYAAEHPEEVWPGTMPLTGRDVIAGFVFKTPFFYGLDETIRKMVDGTGGKDISLGPDNAFLWTPKPTYPIGSNGFAVAPSRSSDGHTRLLINSHQPYSGPVAWYEARLKSEEGLDVTGGTFPGAPVILHGHNRNLGWANTVNKPDLADVYVLEINPDDENQYRFDGAWRDFEREMAAIRVKLAGPFYWTAEREVLHSVHGPVMRTDHGTYAVRYAGMGEVRQLQQYLALDKARNFDEWMDAMRLQALPSINYVYADKDGNIAYIYNAQMPMRAEGWDWQKYLPGDKPELVWEGYHPLEDLPRVINPESGFVINANNTPFEASGEADDPDPADYSATMGIETHMTNRGLRALELFRADPSVSAADFARYKYDVTYSEHSALADLIDHWVQADYGDDARMKEAQALLARWDRAARQDSTEAAVAILAGQPVIWARMRGEPEPDPDQTLREAVDHLMTHWGRLDVPWGEVNRLRRGDVDLPLDGGPDLLRAVYTEKAKDGRLVARGGDTMIYFVDWAPDGSVSSRSIHQFGTATQDATSPHFADQSPMFARMELKRVPLDADVLAGETERVYRPGAADGAE